MLSKFGKVLKAIFLIISSPFSTLLGIYKLLNGLGRKGPRIYEYRNRNNILMSDGEEQKHANKPDVDPNNWMLCTGILAPALCAVL